MINSFRFLFPSVGNQQTVRTFLQQKGLEETSNNSKSTLLIMNGVGHVDSVLSNKTVISKQLASHLDAGGKVLAICLGLQTLFSSNEESKSNRCLGLFKGKVQRMPEGLNVGYKQVRSSEKTFEAYFQNLYGVSMEENLEGFEHIEVFEVAKVKYLAAFATQNIYAYQYHPELSGKDVADEAAKRIGIG